LFGHKATVRLFYVVKEVNFRLVFEQQSCAQSARKA
jgi:hypothetical protein